MAFRMGNTQQLHYYTDVNTVFTADSNEVDSNPNSNPNPTISITTINWRHILVFKKLPNIRLHTHMLPMPPIELNNINPKTLMESPEQEAVSLLSDLMSPFPIRSSDKHELSLYFLRVCRDLLCVQSPMPRRIIIGFLWVMTTYWWEETVPADLTAVRKLVTGTWTEISEMGFREESCGICLEEFGGASEVKMMPCLHVFHGNCISRWLLSHRSCPKCRFEMEACKCVPFLPFDFLLILSN